MKFRGPSASLRPAREAARMQARAAALPRHPTPAGGAAPPETAPVGWRFAVDPDGRLIAVHDGSGASFVLADPNT